MSKPRIVIALGGNALQQNGESTAEAQKSVAQKVGTIIAKLSDRYEVIIAHGNGPQVGNILIHEEQAATDAAPAMPLETAVAMSQGQIGYWLTQAIKNAFIKQGHNRKVATIVTQVVVNQQDPAFKNPTKPIGQFYTAKDALRLAKTKKWFMKEDSGRGYRRVVASPTPIDIVEKREISDLVARGAIVIAVGGGGVPVYRTRIRKVLKGIDAVIDKDFAAAKLSELVYADIFVSVTAVPYAYLNYGTQEQIALHALTPKEAERYAAQGHFKSGSMLPKIQACAQFAKKQKTGIICSIDNLEDALKEKSGTIIG